MGTISTEREMGNFMRIKSASNCSQGINKAYNWKQTEDSWDIKIV
jgi:hypothetical protein